jgi:hypothetical protein
MSSSSSVVHFRTILFRLLVSAVMARSAGLRGIERVSPLGCDVMSTRARGHTARHRTTRREAEAETESRRDRMGRDERGEAPGTRLEGRQGNTEARPTNHQRSNVEIAKALPAHHTTLT